MTERIGAFVAKARRIIGPADAEGVQNEDEGAFHGMGQAPL